MTRTTTANAIGTVVIVVITTTGTTPSSSFTVSNASAGTLRVHASSLLARRLNTRGTNTAMTKITKTVATGMAVTAAARTLRRSTVMIVYVWTPNTRDPNVSTATWVTTSVTMQTT